MKSSTKESNSSSVMCKEHKEKCAFVCLFKTCKDAFKVGCIRCRKDHAQHPNRLISINDFHTMLSKPIRYLETLTAFKLMNLKKKIEYIRNFRTEILEKEISLIDSNKNIKSTISSILEEHYGITDIVSKLDGDYLLNNYEKYVENLQKCKEFMAYNPVKCELVFNNDVIKNSRIQLEKHLKTSHELIDSIREFLVKIIEVLLANCAHDEDDDEIEFAEEGDGATTFNIYVKNRKDVTQNPNIKNKIEHETFLEMFDEEKEALTKEIQFLQKEIDNKSNILQRIRSHKQTDDKQSKEESISEKSQRSNKSQKEINLQAYEQLQITNKQLRQELQKSKEQNLNQALSLNQISQFSAKKEFQILLQNKQNEISQLLKNCCNLQSKLTTLMQEKSIKNENNCLENLRNQLAKAQSDLSKERETVKTLSMLSKQQQSKIAELTNQTSKQTSEFASLVKKYAALQSEFAKKKLESQNQKLILKATQEQLLRKFNEISNKLGKKEQQIEKREKEIQKERKKSLQLEKLLDKAKDSTNSVEKQYQKWREQYQGRQKNVRSQLEKTQKELDALKYKSRNDQQRNKNIETRIKDLNRQIEAKTEIIREKDRIIREKQQSLTSRTSIHNSRIKDLQIQLKTSRTTDNFMKNYEEEIRKHRQTKQLLEMSIKKNQQLKDRNYQLEQELINLKDGQERGLSTSILKYSSNQNSRISQVKDRNKEFNMFPVEQFKVETVNSEEVINNPTKKEEPLKEKKIITNKQEKRLAYMEIKSIFKAVTDDMGILQERLKENSVIQKVYLKELERKRNENKMLKKQLENIKVYGGNFKQTAQNPMSSSLASKTSQKEKKDPHSALPVDQKGDSQVITSKKGQKVNGK